MNRKIFLSSILLGSFFLTKTLTAQTQLSDIKMDRSHQNLQQIQIDDQESIQLLKETRALNVPVTHSNMFTYKILLNQLKTEDDSSLNFVFSPLSLINVLHLLSEGSSGNTHSEINQALWGKPAIGAYENKLLSHWMKKSEAKDSVALWNANALWTNKNFNINKEYNDLVTHQYGATVRSLDFTNPLSKDIINAWVKANTNQLIPSIIDELNPSELLILTNAIYFKEIWLYPFNKQLSKKDIFYSESGHQEVMFMNGKQKVHYKEYKEYIEVGLPLKNNFVYYILLPNEGVSLEDLLENNLEEKNNFASTFNLQKELILSLPKMEIAQTIHLNGPLQQLGLRDLFSSSRANFSKISPTKGLMVSDVLQKAYFKISEEGAEGAAVTSVTMRTTSAVIAQELKINRPFIYFIKNLKDNSTIFAGYVHQISGEE